MDRRNKWWRRLDTADGCAAIQSDFDKLEKWADRNPLKRVWQREMPSRAAGGKDPMHTPAHAEGCLAGKHVQRAGPGCPGGHKLNIAKEVDCQKTKGVGPSPLVSVGEATSGVFSPV